MSTVVNPFGREVKKDTPIVPFYTLLNIVIACIVVLGLIVFVGNGLVVSKYKSNTVDLIQRANEQAIRVESVVKDDAVLANYRQVKNTTQDEGVRHAAEVIVAVAQDIQDNHLTMMTADMTNEEAVMAVVRPAVVCTMVDTVDSDTELKDTCMDYNASMVAMMNGVQSYNRLIDSFSGKLSWTPNTHLPDIRVNEQDNPDGAVVVPQDGTGGEK